MRAVALLLAVAASCYVALCGYYYWAQDRIVFHGAPVVAPTATARDVRFHVPGATLAGWVVNDGEPVDLVYFGGNAEAVAANAARFASIPRARTLLVDYRGYGRSTGTPSQQALLDDATRYIREFRRGRTGPLVLVGRSLGAGVAALAAARVEPDAVALVLISPFTSLVSVAAVHFRWLPVGLLLRSPFAVAAVARSLPSRIAVVIASEDRVVPPAESRALVRALRTPPRVVALADADHDDVLERDETWQTIAQTVDALAEER